MGDNRNRKIDVRFTEDEYQKILDMEKELGISKASLVRMRVLLESNNILVNAKELVAQLDKIGIELGRAGNNINQLARHANTLKLNGALDGSVAVNFNRLFAAYIGQQRTLETVMRKIIRLLAT